MRYVGLAIAFVIGVALRERIGDAYRPMWRSLAIFLGAPLALFSGWRFEAKTSSILALLVLLATELAILAMALNLARRRKLGPTTALGAVSNSGFWSIPIAAGLFGPGAIPFVAIYDVAGVVRPLTIVASLRRFAPERPARTTAAIDYLPSVALASGLVLNVLSEAPTFTGDVLPLLGLLVGLGGFFVLGAAMPQRMPSAEHFKLAAPAVPLRFVLPSTVLLLLVLSGVDIPAAAWVVALSPSAFMTISLGRLYRYDQRLTAAVPILTVPIAAALLPLVRALGG